MTKDNEIWLILKTVNDIDVTLLAPDQLQPL